MADLRTDHDSSSGGNTGRGRGSTRRRPRWVNVFGIIVIAVFLLILAQHLLGGGMGGHTP